MTPRRPLLELRLKLANLSANCRAAGDKAEADAQAAMAEVLRAADAVIQAGQYLTNLDPRERVGLSLAKTIDQYERAVEAWEKATERKVKG